MKRISVTHVTNEARYRNNYSSSVWNTGEMGCAKVEGQSTKHESKGKSIVLLMKLWMINK